MIDTPRRSCDVSFVDTRAVTATGNGEGARHERPASLHRERRRSDARRILARSARELALAGKFGRMRLIRDDRMRCDRAPRASSSSETDSKSAFFGDFCGSGRTSLPPCSRAPWAYPTPRSAIERTSELSSAGERRRARRRLARRAPSLDVSLVMLGRLAMVTTAEGLQVVPVEEPRRAGPAVVAMMRVDGGRAAGQAVR